MLGVALLFVLLGIMVKYGKMYYLIAGYNTLPKERQALIDIAGIATLLRNVMFTMALGLVIGYLLALWLKNPAIETYSIIIILAIGIPYLIIRSNSKKYEIKNKR